MHTTGGPRTIQVLGIAPLSVTAAVLFFNSGPASACSTLSKYDSSLPTPGCALPKNASMLLQGQGLSIVDATAVLDGTQALLEVIETVNAADGSEYGIVVALAGTPESGQLSISGALCLDDECSIDLEFDLQGEDLQIDHRVGEVAYDVHRWNGGDPAVCAEVCQNGDTAVYVRVRAEIDPNDDSPAPLLLDVRGGLAADGGSGLARTIPLLEVESVLTFSLLASSLPNPDVLCFEARIRDTAGNTSGWIASPCAPCRSRTEPMDSAASCALTAPDWPAEPVVNPEACLLDRPPGDEQPAYACDVGGSTGQSASETGGGDAGCACTACGRDPEALCLLMSSCGIVFWRRRVGHT